jgi:hypothetical protein
MSGEIPVLLDNYPELGLFRDIVFTFKLLQVPTGDGLPDLQPWMATDAAFTWKYKQVSADFHWERASFIRIVHF